jgi:hypothetical protein
LDGSLPKKFPAVRPFDQDGRHNRTKLIPPFSIFSLSAILVGSRDQRTQFWKGAIQESSQQNLVDIGSVVSEEKIGRQAKNRKRGMKF